MSRVLPIIFNTEMIKAILYGNKTVTRRICKDGNDYVVPDMSFYDAEKRSYAVHNYADKEHNQKLSIAERTCPICPGDILYVRETWGFDRGGIYIYKSTYKECFTESQEVDCIGNKIKWRPSIHMPKEAARIWLKVTDVRVERLQDITEEQAIKEGFIGERCNHAVLGEHGCTDCMNTGWIEPPQVGFMYTWNSTVKEDSQKFEANPYVWVIEFERCEKPEEGGKEV